MRLGFFGGTFNPVHKGHLVLAQWAVEALRLNHLWWLPANPWQKEASLLINAHDRTEMIKAAIRDFPNMSVDSRELDRCALSYSIDTVKELANDYPNDDRFYLIGSDQWKNFHTWKCWQNIFNFVNLVVFTRNGQWDEPHPEVADFVLEKRIKIIKLEMPALDIDSSRIRALLFSKKASQEELLTMLPSSVLDYLKSKLNRKD